MNWLRRSGAMDETLVKKAKKQPIVLPPRIEQIIPPKPRKQRVRITYASHHDHDHSPIHEEESGEIVFSPDLLSISTRRSDSPDTASHATHLPSGTVLFLQQDPVSLRYFNADYPCDPDVEAVVAVLNMGSLGAVGSPISTFEGRFGSPLERPEEDASSRALHQQPWRPATRGGTLNLLDRSAVEQQRIREEQRDSYRKQMKLADPPTIVRFPEILLDEIHERQTRREQRGQLSRSEDTASDDRNGGAADGGKGKEKHRPAPSRSRPSHGADRSGDGSPSSASKRGVAGALRSRKRSVSPVALENDSVTLPRLCTVGVTLLEYVGSVIKLRVLQYQKQLADVPVGTVVDPYVHETSSKSSKSSKKSVDGADEDDEEEERWCYYHPRPFTYAELVESPHTLSEERRRELRAAVLGCRTRSPEVYHRPVPYTANPENASLSGRCNGAQRAESEEQRAQPEQQRRKQPGQKSDGALTKQGSSNSSSTNLGVGASVTPLQPNGSTLHHESTSALYEPSAKSKGGHNQSSSSCNCSPLSTPLLSLNAGHAKRSSHLLTPPTAISTGAG